MTGFLKYELASRGKKTPAAAVAITVQFGKSRTACGELKDTHAQLKDNKLPLDSGWSPSKRKTTIALVFNPSFETGF